VNPGDTASRSRTVTTEDIERFTALTGDRNPLHYDAALAQATRFGGIVVQGGITTGLLNAVVAEDLPGPGSVFLHVDWNFRAAVQPGDEITAEAEVLDARADKHLWAGHFEGNSRDVLALQDELASAIASEIHVQLTPTGPYKFTILETRPGGRVGFRENDDRFHRRDAPVQRVGVPPDGGGVLRALLRCGRQEVVVYGTCKETPYGLCGALKQRCRN
jgi:acyl dehydratase